MTAVTKQEGAAVVHTDDTGAMGQLLTLAIEKGVPIETLERLQLMYERAHDRAAASEFAAALAAFQAACPSIPKTRTAEIKKDGVKQYSYQYAELDQIVRTIAPALRDRGLAYSWDSRLTDKRLVVACTLRHINGHRESSSFELPVEALSKMSEAQKHGAALTYGRRQSLVQVLGLTTTDPDTDGAGDDLDQTPITEDQAVDLLDRMKEAGLKLARFLKWARIERVGDLPATRFDEAVAKIRAFAEQKAGAT